MRYIIDRYALADLFFICILAIGLVLSTSTQLRFAGGPLGPGELVLLFWCFVALGKVIMYGHETSGFALKLVSTFWVNAFTLLSAGLIFASATKVSMATNPWHDLISFSFVALITLSFSLVRIEFLDRQLLGRVIFIVTAIWVACLFFLGILVFEIGSSRFWYSGIRFTGLSKNPNQLALLLVVAPFIGVFCLRASASGAAKIGYGFGIAIIVAAGILTGSDALYLAWGSSSIMILLIVWFRNLKAGRPTIWSFFIGWVLWPVIVFGIATLYWRYAYEFAVTGLSAAYELGGQGSVRLSLWGNGAAAILESPVFGFGPGSHSGIGRPFENFEAHNTFVDWGTSTGLLGVLLYVWLLATVAWEAIRSKRLELFFGVLALTVFSIFHYVLRHPMFWFQILSILYFCHRRTDSGCHSAVAFRRT